MENNITPRLITKFADELIATEHGNNTVRKYSRDISRLLDYCGETPLTKQTLIGFKSELVQSLAPASVNSVIAAVNSYLDFIRKPELKLRGVKIQRNAAEERELTRAEYCSWIPPNRRATCVRRFCCKLSVPREYASRNCRS